MALNKPFKRLFADLVSASPPEEHRADNETTVVAQEVSTRRPTIRVPQGDSARDDYTRALLLCDAAMTPKDMKDAFGIPAWALDTARLWRAANICKEMGIYPPDTEHLTREQADSMYRALQEHYKGASYQYAAAMDRAHLLLDQDLSRGLGSSAMKLRTWADVVAKASEWADRAEENQEPRKGPMPNEGGAEGESGNDSSSEDQSGKSKKRGKQGELGSGEGDDWSGADKGQRQDEGMRKPTPNYGEDPELDRAMQSWQGSMADSSTESWRDWLKELATCNPWHQGKLPSRFEGSASPGKLVNADQPDKLPMQRLKKRKGGRRRSEQEGSFPRKMHRLFQDGKIFRGSAIRGGAKGRGTILVDLSGSMSWTQESIQECLEALPECTIFGYAGHAGKGRIVLLADRGKAASPEAIGEWKRAVQLGNCVDAPALEILARMPKPRIWVSDGGVTNGDDHQTEGIVALCASITARGRITRVMDPAEAVEIVHGRK